MDMVQVVKYEITKRTISGTPIFRGAKKEDAQDYIKSLMDKPTHGYNMVKKSKNTLTYKKQITSDGEIKYLYFKLITKYAIPMNPKDVVEIQKMC